MKNQTTTLIILFNFESNGSPAGQSPSDVRGPGAIIPNSKEMKYWKTLNCQGKLTDSRHKSSLFTCEFCSRLGFYLSCVLL